MLPVVRCVVGHVQVVVSLHALAIAFGVGAGAALAVRRAAEPAPVLAAVVAATLGALPGAHALFVFQHGPAAGGLASIGGIATGLLAAWVVARLASRSPAAVLDAIVPAGLLALAIGRIGCYLRGCCYGCPTSLPWGVVFPEIGPPARHPLQLYSAVADLLLLRLLPARAVVPGAIAARGCLGFGLVRATLEFLRDPATTDVLPGWLTLPQAAALLLSVGALTCARCLHPHASSTMPRQRRATVHGR